MIACSPVALLATLLVAQAPTYAVPPLMEDWEEEASSGWSNPSGCTFSAVEAGRAWNGQRSLHAQYTGTAGCALVHWIGLSTTTPFIRMWLYVPVGTAERIASSLTSVTLVEASTGTDRIGLGLGAATLMNARPIVFLQPVVDGSPMTAPTPEDTEVTEGTWHLVEIGYSAGQFSIWIDDVQQPRATWLYPRYSSLTFTSVTAGTLNGVGTGALDVFIDTLAMGGSQIGTSSSPAIHANEVDWARLDGSPPADAPPGKAGGLVQVGAGNALATDALDFKVGARALVATDTDTTTPAQVNAQWGAFSPTTSSVYRRFWWKPGDLAAPGSRTLAAILDSSFTTSPLAGLGTPLAAVDASGTALTLWGYDSTGAKVSTAFQRPATSGWNLVELLVGGLGGPGERLAYLNGQPAGARSGLDFTGRRADRYVEGQIATSVNDYAGTDSFDEIRTSTRIQPSTIRVFAPETAGAGECTPFELRSLASNLALPPVPAPASITLAGATFYSDSACGTAVSQVELPPGSTSTRLSFMATSGSTASLSAATPDYLAVPATVVLSGTDMTAPARPTSVARQPAIVGAGGQVRVTWAASASPDVSDYSVEMLGPSSPAPLVVSAPATVAMFQPAQPGQWQIHVVASDVVGNQSPPSPMVSLLVDWGAPVIPTFNAGPAVGNGTVSLAWPGVMDPYTAQEPASGLSEFVIDRVSPDGGTPVTLPADAGHLYQYTVEPSAPDGVYVFRLVASDNAGNQAAQYAQPVVVDRAAPVVATVGVDQTVTNSDVVVSWTASDGTGSGVASAEVTASDLDGGTQAHRILPPATQTTFALPEGQYTFEVVANDLAGNASLPATSEQVIVDTTPPATPRSLSAAPGAAGVDLTWSTSTDALSGVEQYLVYASRDGITWDSPLSASGTTYSYAASPGTYWLKVTAVDRAANESGPSPVAMAIVLGLPKTIVLEAVPPVWTGQPVDLIATVIDDAGNPLTTFTGTVQFTGTPNGVVVPPDYTFTLADAGRHRFVAGASFPAGMSYLTATDAASGVTGTLNVNATAPGPPVIVSTPLTTAIEGQPYRYDADGAIEAYGVQPISYSTDTPNLQVDPMTGAVLWIPPLGSAPTTYDFTVIATNSSGTTSQSFSVTVSTLNNPLAPTLHADPNPALAPATVTLSATAGSAWPSTYAWDFGDGSAAPAGTASFASHRYAFPGSYRPRVDVRDDAGAESTASTILRLSDSAGHTPPVVQIDIPGTQGDAPYQVLFQCKVSQGSTEIASYAWDFGDGTTSTEPAPTKTFGPGRYHVHLYVTDTAGLIARDEAVITVTESGALPPSCRASVDPPQGPVPAQVRFTASAAPGQSPISEIEWLDDGGNVTPGSSIVASFDTAGWHRRRLKVVDEAGRVCWDDVAFTGYAQEGVTPLAIISSPPSTAECGVKLEYQLVAVGAPPLEWSVASAPEGLTLDASSGKMVWTPSPAQSGTNPVELRASGSGTATQRFEVAVSCKSKLDLTTGCTGCTAAGGGGPIAALLLMLLAARRRR